MEGGRRILWKWLTSWIVLLFCSLFVIPQPAHAAPPLQNLLDSLSSIAVNQPGVQHDITFTLPYNGVQVTPSDYILIDLPHFLNIVPPSSVYGGYGQPIITQTGTRIAITNLAILPGAYVQVLGITTTNPNLSDNFDVTVSIADNVSGTVIRQQSTIQANQEGPFTSVSATVESQYALLIITGFTGPDSFVTLGENGTVVGTTQAAGDGSFTLSVSGLSSQEHVFDISSTDQNNLTTAVTTETVYTLPQTLTSISDVLLSPTIHVSPATIAPGDTLTISGTAEPLSTVNLFTESPLVSYTTTTDANGNWTYTLSSSVTSQMQPGQYRAYANVEENSGTQSIVSNTVNFTVALPVNDNNPAPACDISHGDLNCDGKVNLSDFSILLYYWGTNRKAADINSDGKVNLTDFSIMMFYFQK